MGVLDRSVNKGRTKQKEAILEEAAEARCQVVEVLDSEDESTAASVLGGVMASLVGGSVQHDSFQTFILATGGVSHVYVQPYHGMLPVPGEHHVRIDGALPGAVVLRKKFLGRLKWEGDASAAVSQVTSLRPTTKALKWKWSSGMSEIELKWTVQIRPLGRGRSHLVMQAGRYGGFTTYKIGFRQFLRLVSALGGSLADSPEIAPQDFIERAMYAPVFERCLAVRS